MKPIAIGRKTVSAKDPCFIIAEAGVNHNGSLKMAKQLIDAAALAKADAVKFQTFNPRTLVTRWGKKAEYQTRNIGKESHFEMLDRLKLPREWHKELKQYAQKKGLIFLSTPFSLDDALFLKKLGVVGIKVGSSDTNNIPYLAEIATWDLPIILSVGMSDLAEIRESVRTIKKAGCKDLIVLHCTTSYPAPFELTNLRAMETLRKELGVITGFSDHTEGIEAAIASVALGARVLEKHFTLSRKLPGPDHLASLEPDELKLMISSIRNVEMAMGSGKKIPFKAEKEIAKIARKSVVAAVDIKKGTVITDEMVTLKRPGTGILPKYLPKVVGKVAKRDIQQESLLRWSDLAVN